jgi:release factor glutamine methyltransferase
MSASSKEPLPEPLLVYWRAAYTSDKPRPIHLEGHELILHPGVFNPAVGWATIGLIEAMPPVAGKAVLDMGCGTGGVGIIAAHRGASTVLLADLDPLAVQNAKENVELHHLGARVKVFQSDLFAGVPEQRFDIIFFNWPYLWWEEPLADNVAAEVAPGAPGIWAYFDHEYALIRRFFRAMPRYLTPGGAAYLTFAEYGNWPLLARIVAEEGLRHEIVHTRPDGDPALGDFPNIQIIRAWVP